MGRNTVVTKGDEKQLETVQPVEGGAKPAEDLHDEPLTDEVDPVATATTIVGGASGAIQGGSSGAPPQTSAVASALRGLEDPKIIPEAPGGVKARKWRVIPGGPESAMYHGQRVPVRIGKEISEANTDVALLLAQGIRLEEIKDAV